MTQIEFEYRAYYYNILRLFFLRKEFALENLRLLQKGRLRGLLVVHTTSLKAEGAKVSVGYQTLLYKTLRLSLDKMTGRGHIVELQTFIESFLAIAYFRIPEFRSKILECFPDERNVQLDEWKPTHFSLDETALTGAAMQALFNWDKEFYDAIPSVSSLHSLVS